MEFIAPLPRDGYRKKPSLHYPIVFPRSFRLIKNSKLKKKKIKQLLSETCNFILIG